MIIFFLLSVYLPIDSWQNELLEEIQVRGIHFEKFPSVRPYHTRALNSQDNFQSDDRLWLPNISGRIQYDTISIFRLKPTVYYDVSNFSICVQPVVKFGDDSLPPSKLFMDLFSAHYERAYISYHGRHVGAFIGRERFAIGPSPRYNLLLSGYSAPMDWISYFVQSSKLRFSFFLARLEDMQTKPLEYVGDTISGEIDAKRYLTVKRLDFSPYPWLNFGLSEAAVFGGENYTLQLYHLNPVVFVQAYQYNWAHDVNFFLNFDAKVFFNNISFYASLLLDDFQLETDPNREPNHWGINVGSEMADVLGIENSFWVLEYTALSRYTYCHFVPYQRYHYRETLIGSPYGPDYDEIFTKFTYHLTEMIDIFAQIAYLRKGEETFLTLWPIPEPREQGTFFPENNFLSGTTQKTVDLGIGARYFMGNLLAIELFAGFSHFNEFKHVSDEQKNSAVIRVQVDMFHL